MFIFLRCFEVLKTWLNNEKENSSWTNRKTSSECPNKMQHDLLQGISNIHISATSAC